MKNARFWAHVNDGYVKITLEPGQRLSWGESHPTDEGFSYQSESWTFEGETITRESASGGRDCDGRIDYYRDSECSVYCLAARQYEDGEFTPEWVDTGSSQRDEYAEAIGY